MKTLFKYIVGFGLGNNLSFPLLRPMGRRRLIILYYHRVISKEECRDVELSGMCVNVNTFSKQMGILKKFYNFVSENDIVGAIENGKKLPDYSVWITFDDGWKDNYTNAFPILKNYSIPATLFVTIEYVNKNYGFMNWQEIKEAAECDISIGAHTISHRILSGLSNSELEKEIAESKNKIEQRLGKRVISFAYPIGKKQHYCLEKCIPILKKNSFKLAVTTIGGFNAIELKQEPFNLRRMGISYEDTLSIFKFKISLGGFWQR